MLTYSGQLSLYQTLTNNTSSSNQTNGNLFIQQFTLELIHKYPFIVTERTFTSLQTFPSQQFYNISSRLRKLNTVTVNVGGTSGFNWPVKEAPSMDYWNNLNLTNNITSDIPEYWFLYNGQLGLYPRPASGYNPITIRGQVEIAPTSTVDYTTGTITDVPFVVTLTGALASGATSATLNSAWTLPTGTYQMITSAGGTVLVTLTNGLTTVTWSQALTAASTSSVTIRTANGGDIMVGSGTGWTTAQTGFVIQVSEAQGGDNFFYTISTVYDTTHLALNAPYEGNSIAGSSKNYTLGEASVIPPSGQFIPVFRAVELYYTTILPDTVRQAKYKELADNAEAAMRADYGNKSTDPTINDDDTRPAINPNLTINNTQSTGV